MRPSPAESKWTSKCSTSPPTQQACGGVYVAKHLITPQSFASKPYRSVHGAGGGGRGHGGEGCSASPSCPNCSGPHSASWLGCPEYRTRLLANKIKSQTYIPYNHAIRQAKHILHNYTTTNRPAHTTPQSSRADQPQNQQQTATQKTVTTQWTPVSTNAQETEQCFVQTDKRIKR